MNIDEYISHLRSKNILVSVKDDKLAIKDPDGALTKELIEELKQRKEEILDLLIAIRNRKQANLAIPKAPVQEYYPLSSAQKRMYFLYEFDKKSTAYNMPMAYQIKGDLDVKRMEAALISLLDRHESLRTVFKTIDDEIVQHILDGEGFEIQYKESSEEKAQQDFKDFIQPFNLEKEYPVRVCILSLAKDNYILMMDFHHIIGDLRSSGILTQDFFTMYLGNTLPELRIQYKDFAVWQNSESQLALRDKAKTFWLSEYEEDVYALELPTDNERPLVKTNNGATLSFTIDKTTMDKLSAVSKEIGATLFMSLFGVYNLLLNKLANTNDIVVGTPISGRKHADLEHIVGMFLNILPVRSHIQSSMTVKEFLTVTKDKMLVCMDSQSYQYEELIVDLELPRNASRNPLFDVMFVFEKEQQKSIITDNLVFEEFKSEGTTAKFDLLLTCVESETGLKCHFEYYKELFEEETIQNFSTYFSHIVSQLVENTNKKLSEISLLSKNEQFAIIEKFNQNTKNYESEKTIQELFEAQAALTPKAIALDFMGSTLTYQELNQSANQLARVLREKGVTRNSIVGIMQKRSSDAIIAILAIFKAGGAYLPIDINYPPKRVEAIVKDSEMQLLLCDQELDAEFEEKVTCINTKTYAYQDQENTNLDTVNTHEDLLYVIYTSGSTGTPKGLKVNHRNLTNLMDFHNHSTSIDTTSVLQFTTLTFDPSFVEIFSALLTGGRLYLINEVVATDFSKLLSHIQTNAIKTIYMPSSVLNQMFNSQFYLDELPDSLNSIISAGEQLVVGDLFKTYLAQHEVYLYNYYGPAETQVITANTISPKVPIASMPNIGKPIQNTQIYILNDSMQQQPVNVAGELFAGGYQVGDGYVSNEKLTADRFVVNPFKKDDIVYKTGDLAKWLPDGTIEFLGRADTQIKFNGVRIEPGEIEGHIKGIDTIADAAVIIKEVRGNKSLVAYYVSENEMDTSILRAVLIEKLPVNMIPGYFVHLTEMPLTATGKLARRVLPMPKENIIKYKAPTNATEEQLVMLWTELLNLKYDQISVNRSFFELGGNSLNAINLVNKISKEFEIEMTLKEIFVKQTIQNISEYIITVRQMEAIQENNNQTAKLLL